MLSFSLEAIDIAQFMNMLLSVRTYLKERMYDFSTPAVTNLCTHAGVTHGPFIIDIIYLFVVYFMTLLQ
jgi:hypothetical protein